MDQEEKKNSKSFWMDWIQLFCIVLLAPFFIFPSMKYTWIFTIIPVIWICRWIVKKRLLERIFFDWAIALLFIQVFATCIIVPDLGFSLPKISGILFGLFFFYSIVALLDSEKLIKWGVTVFLGGGFVLSIIGILGMKLDYESILVSVSRIINKKLDISMTYKTISKNIPFFKWNLPGAEEGFNSNAVGGILILVIPLCFVLFLSYLRRSKGNYLISYRLFHPIFFFIILSVMCSVLLLTQSIGSWIGLITSIWILLLPLKWKKWSLIITFFLIVSLFISMPTKTKSLIDVFKHDEDIANRRIFFTVGINTIKQNPFFGIGMNRIRLIPTVGYEKSHVHNHLIHTAAELGIPALIAYIAILFGMGFMCFKIWSKSNVGWMRMTALGLGCGQLSHIIFGIADSIPLGAKIGIFFWLSFGLIAAMYNYMLKKNVQIYTQVEVEK